jgi:adenylate kinase family enzyme
VAVIGCGGAGKTTLANALGHRLGLPVVHIDGHYWHDPAGTDGVESTYAEWRRIHDELIAGDRWVIDGMKLGALDARLAAADTVVFLDLSTSRCLWGVVERRLRHRRKARPEIGVYDVITVSFLRWIWSFRSRVRPRILEKLDECACDVVLLRNRRDVRAFVDSLERPDASLAAQGHAGRPAAPMRLREAGSARTRM